MDDPHKLILSDGRPFTLRRYPLLQRDQLRAWDAADELLLDYLAGKPLHRPLILNDQFGTLSCALAETKPISYTDSYIANLSLERNLKTNRIAPDSVTLNTSLDSFAGQYSWVLFKLPKSLSALEDLLLRLKPHLTESSQVIGAAMAKQIHTSTLELFEKLIGPTKSSLAKKRARLIFSDVDPTLELPVNPYPSSYQLPGYPNRVFNHAAVFSRRKLDIGTRFFLQHLPQTEGPGRIVDLGCGNGVVGLMAAAANPEAQVLFTDESYMAVDSARLTFEHAGLSNSVEYRVGDTLQGVEQASQDLVLCNPPFHQNNVVGDAIAWRMFKTSRDVLVAGGEFWIVGNRHLRYQQKLKHLFGNSEQIAANSKFVILRSIKR